MAISYTNALNLPFLPKENHSALEGWGIELSTLGYGYVYESGRENCHLNQLGHDTCVQMIPLKNVPAESVALDCLSPGPSSGQGAYFFGPTGSLSLHVSLKSVPMMIVVLTSSVSVIIIWKTAGQGE